MDLAAAQSARAPAPSDTIGRVATVNGAQASIELSARAAEQAPVGQFVGLTLANSVIIGLITEVAEQVHPGAAATLRKMARLDLVGELRNDNGKARFERGVTD